MRFDKINIPNEILLAQRQEKLVIFAGAGVSMGDPSKLPNFDELYKEVSKSLGIPPNNDIPLDQAFGELEKTPPNFRRTIQEILGDPESKPNKLHENIFKLFPNKKSIRIVTTNFDTHFSKINKEYKVEEFYAPALPQGNNFEGLVYLHGSLQKELDKLVITDEDFSKAYITKGWAVRFLIDLFDTYTILFIGFSYDDLLMRYLTKGLPSNTKPKYIITDNKNKQRWASFKIEPIIYEEDKHEQLEACLQDWCKFTHPRFFELKDKVINIAKQSPSHITEKDKDFLLEFAF